MKRQVLQQRGHSALFPATAGSHLGRYYLLQCHDDVADRGIVQTDGPADFGECISLREIGLIWEIQCAAESPGLTAHRSHVILQDVTPSAPLSPTHPDPFSDPG